MSNLPISGLPAAAALTGAELVPVVQGAVTKKSDIDAIITYLQSLGLYVANSGGTFFAGEIPVYSDTTGEFVQGSGCSITNLVINSRGITFTPTTTEPGLKLKNLPHSDIVALSASTYPGAEVFDTTNNQIMWSNGTAWANLTGNTGLDFGYVTVGGGSAQYANFTTALAAGKNKFWVIGSFSETSDVTIFNSDDYSVICNPGVIVTFSNASLIINNNVSNLFWRGGTLLYAMSSAPKNWLQYYGVGKANSFFTDCIIQSISTQAGSYWNDNPVGGTVQVFNNVQWIFPDISGNGPRIGGGTSTIMRMSGGGTSCDDILTVTGGNVSGLTLNGVYSTNTVLSFGECTWSNSYIGSNTGAPLARVNLYNNASVNNVIAKSDAGWRLVPIGQNISVNNFISGDIGSFFTGAGSDAVNVSNSVIASASITISPFAPVFTNVNFTQTSDLTIQSTAADLTSCKFACNVVLDADFITLNTPKVGDTNAGSLTISVSGVDQCSINSPITEADIVDGGTNTGIANPRKW